MEWKHINKRITVTQRGDFLVEELGDTFPSLQEAKKAIEQEAKLTDVNLKVLWDDGADGVITKVHRGTGRFILKTQEGTTVQYYHRLSFPCARTRSLLADVRRAKGQLAALEEQLQDYQLTLPSRYQYSGHEARTVPTIAHQMHQDALKTYEQLEQRFGAPA